MTRTHARPENFRCQSEGLKIQVVENYYARYELLIPEYSQVPDQVKREYHSELEVLASSFIRLTLKLDPSGAFETSVP
ncbi:hypothetical protein VTK26DRAFT_1484 [Humicola hyalothermophila]